MMTDEELARLKERVERVAFPVERDTVRRLIAEIEALRQRLAEQEGPAVQFLGWFK